MHNQRTRIILIEELIHSFIKKMQYDPELNLPKYADSLYEDIGAVAMPP